MMMLNQLRRTSTMVCTILLLLTPAAIAAEPATPEIPRLAGDWWRLAAPPVLERFHKPGVQTVDFTIFQAGDGTWQLVSCVRGTDHPGGGRLLYRWEAAKLTDKDWTPRGIFWTADVSLGQKQGTIQAPHCIKLNGKWYFLYNSNGAYCLISDDGKAFRHHRTSAGELKFFDMPRDLMLLDNTQRDGLWYAYFTDILPGRYPQRRDHTIGARTAKALEGPWSEKKLEITVISPTPELYTFVYTESPFVLFRNGFYYRLEQMNVLASTSPTRWDGGILTTLTPKNPQALLAPEIVEHEGRHYIAAYRNHGRDGIFMAEMTWGAK